MSKSSYLETSPTVSPLNYSVGKAADFIFFLYKAASAVFYHFFPIQFACRFVPSCSEYAKDALHRHGAVGGLRLILKRMSKCRPGHPGGIDPVL